MTSGAAPDKTLLVVHHTMTDGTRQMAEAAVRGARAASERVQVRSLRAREAGPDDVLGADGYLFATPENLASMSGMMPSVAVVSSVAMKSTPTSRVIVRASSSSNGA
jgi:hypothetical protein